VGRRATSITLEGPRASWAALMRRRLSCEHRQAAWARRCVITGVAIAALWATIVGRLWPGSELAGFRGPALVACLIVAPLYGTAVIGSLLSSMLGCKEDVDRDSLWRVASVALLASGLLTCGIAALTASIIFAMGWSFHVGGTAFVIAACMAGVPAGRMFARLTRSGATYLPGDIDDEFTPEPLDDPPPIASAAPSRTITLPDVDSRGVMRAQFRLRTGVMRCVFVLALGLAAGFVGTILSAGLQRAHPGDTWTQAFLLAAPIALCVSFAGSAFWASIRLAPPARARELSLASLVNTNVRWLLTRTLKHAAWMLPVTCVGYFFGRSLFLEKPAFRLLPALTLGAIDVTPYLAWQTWKIWRAQRKSTQSRSSRER